MKRFTIAISAVAALLPACTAAAGVDPVVQSRLAVLPVPFVPNVGQWDREAAFAAHTFAGTLFVTRDGRLVYSLGGKPASGQETARHPGLPPQHRPGERVPARAAGWVLAETFVDARQQPLRPLPAGHSLQQGTVGYAIGNDRTRHRDRVAAYERVKLGNVYPGIDVQLRATGTNVEKVITVAPRHDPGQIRIRLSGARRLELGPQGELIVHTGNGPVVYTAPVAYQLDASGNRKPVPVRYALDRARQMYGFRVGRYDAGQPLVIDPLLQSTYLGGSSIDAANVMAIHPVTGEVYVAGYTGSADFPKTAGGAQDTYTSGIYAFVTRLNAALTVRLQSTYLGGSSDNIVTAMAIHPSTGEVYLAGYTASTDFPCVAGAEQAIKGLLYDGFVTRLNATLTACLQSTYLGGNSTDQIHAIAIHPTTGDVYVAGDTKSTDFPKTAGAEQGTHAVDGGTTDAFVTRLNAALTTRLQSTYLGGNSNDYATGLAIRPGSGEIYVTGRTASTDFPKVAGAEQVTSGGNYDAYVTRLDSGLTTILQSTYLGGGIFDSATAIAVHPASGEVYVAGYTASSDFPKVSGAEQTVLASPGDAFVARLDSTLTTRLQSTYLGGSGDDVVNALAIHPYTGDVYVTGNTQSTDFPKMTGGAQPAHAAGVYDAFVTRLNAALTMRLQSTYLGGTADDLANALAIHPATGEVYVTGETHSTDLPRAAGAEQVDLGGPIDGFVSRFSPDLLAFDAYPDPFGFGARNGVPAGSLQASPPALITGMDGPASIRIIGAGNAQYCISSAHGCACDVQAYTGADGTIANNQYVCVRQFAPSTVPGVGETSLSVGGRWGKFFVATGTAISGCSVDVDGNGAQDALTDGLLVIRALFGLTGTSVTNGAIGSGATRTDWASIRAYLNGSCGANLAP